VIGGLIATRVGQFALRAQAQDSRSVWDGVYTEEQGKRVEVLCRRNCAGCHGDNLAGAETAPLLARGDFLANWDGSTVGDLFERIRISMPADRPGKLTREQIAENLAHYQSFLGVPLIDRGVLQGVLVVQTIEPRVFQEYEIRMLGEATAQVGPVVSEARTLDRFIAPAQEKLWSLARNVWWSWDNKSASLFRDLDPEGLEKMSSCAWQFVDRILTHGNDLCLLMNASVNAYRRLDPHFEAPNQLKASATDRGSMVRIPIGNSRSARVEVRAVAPDANPYLVLYGIFKTGIEGDIAQIDNLRNAPRYLPDNIYDAIENFDKSDWTTKLLGEDVKGRYADLKRAAADRCARSLGTVVKAPEVQYHHEVYTQYLWNMF
jgi:hypothetical protein